MKAAICDSCHTVVPDPDGTATLYAICIEPANGNAPKRPREKANLFDAPHVCPNCTKEIRAAIIEKARELRVRRKQSS